MADENDKLIELRVSEVNIGDSWPCPDDKLGRKDEIENLTPVLLNVQSPLVFAVDAPWGAGKTTFVNLWQLYLKSQGKNSLYINAWESDFAEDPLLPILSVFDDWLGKEGIKPASKKAWEKVKQCAPRVIKSTAVAAAKAATFGALDLDKEYEKILADLSGHAVNNLVDIYKAKEKLLDKFKKTLSKTLDALPEDQTNLIVFIDELDRCKPTYAIEMLERIKHLFNINRVVFVLSINRDQLSKSLKGVYGPEFDGSHYLKRFIDLDYQLSINDIDSYVSLKIRQNDIQDNFSKRKNSRSDLDTLIKIIVGITRKFDYKLRDIDQLVMRLRLIIKSIPLDQAMDIAVLASLLILREKNNGLYQTYVSTGLCANEVVEFLMGRYMDIEYIPNYYSWVAGSLIHAAKDEYSETDHKQLIEPWQKLFDDMTTDDKRRHQIERIIDIATNSYDMWHHSDIKKVNFNRIELVYKINI